MLNKIHNLPTRTTVLLWSRSYN